MNPDELVLGTTVKTVRELGGQAQYVLLADGRELVLKGVPRQQQNVWQPGTPWTELVVTDLVSSQGGPVPMLAAADLNAGSLLLRAYVPGPTLASLWRKGGPADALFVSLFHALAELTHIVEAHPRDVSGYVTATSAADARALALSIVPFLTPKAQHAWQQLVDQLLTENGWYLGPTDVQPANVIIGRHGPVFIDLATIGYDYTERRLAAYGQLADPLQPATGLTEDGYRAYGDWAGTDAALRLALFDHLFWGLALTRLLVMKHRPDSEAATQLKTHWTPDDDSWYRLHALWARPRIDEPRLHVVRDGWQTKGIA